MSDEGEFDQRKLNKLIKTFTDKPPMGRVGVLAKNQRRGAKDETNSSVGLKHEFGDPAQGIPQRSFLRVPIATGLQKALEAFGAFDEDVMKEVIKRGTLIPYLKRVVIIAESLVLEAFETGGMGQWKPSNMTLKKNHQTLVETGQLRNSITSEVEE